MSGRTIPQVLDETVAQHSAAPALRQPNHAEQGGYTVFSWNEYKQAADEIAAGLGALGIGKGAMVALDSETRLEFYLADLGILGNGSIAAALYPSYPPADLVRTVQTIGARAVFVEDAATFAAIHTTAVPHWIVLTGEAPGAITLAELRGKGRERIAAEPGLIAELRQRLDPADPAILYLSSGATGEPKMALVTHGAVTANLDMGPYVLPIGPEDATVAFLPSAHIAQRVVIEFLPLRCGMPVTFFESLNKLPHDIRKVRPTLLLAPPRMWERIYSTICTELRKRPVIARRAFYASLAMSLAAARYRRAGKPVPLRLRVPLKLADKLIFAKVRERFGGRIRVAASGAAPLSSNLAEFYDAVGMPIVEGYGLTEGGVAALNPLDRPLPGSIGKALPGVEMRILDDEILIKSPCLFSGYWNDPEATAEALRDGWLHTGDLGRIDPDGYVYITGRRKDLIVSSTGKKVHPSRIEALFKMEPLVSNLLLIGDRLPFVTALFTLNPMAAMALKGMEGVQASEISTAAPVTTEIRKAVARVNKHLAPFEQIRKYRILPREFSIEQGELTATMKVRRQRAIENFKPQIDELYAGREEAANV